MDGSPAPDGGRAAGGDAAGGDAAGGASGAGLELFATIGASLVRLDATTGDATEIGLTGLGPVAKLAFHSGSGVLYGIVDYLTAPKLVTVDVCTGQATLVAALFREAGAASFAGGFDYDPVSARLYATVSIDGSYPSESNEEHLVTIDPANAEMTSVGDLLDGAALIDGDEIALAPGQALVIDSDPSSNSHILWDLDRATGAATGARTAASPLDWVEFHLGAFYGWTPSGPLARNLVTVNPSTAELTGVGPTHTAGEFGGSPLLAMSEAVAVCRD